MNKMELGNTLDISQDLELTLSPQMIQMLKVLNLSYMELVEEMDKATEENVMLELEKPDRLLEYMKHIVSERIPKKEIMGEELPGIENLSDAEETLEQHLIKQLDLEDKLTDIQRSTAEMIIGNIDQRGYLQDYPGISSSIMKELNVSQSEVDDALDLIQTFEPDGVGARDLKECLLLQIRAHNFDNEELEDVMLKAVEGHLDDLAEKKFDKIAKALGITRTGAEKLSEFIRSNLNPTPGSQYSEEVICAIPSFLIKKEKDKYKAVNLEKNYGPVIKLNPTYEKMLRDPKTDAKTIEFLKERLHAAKNFMENVAKRHETIEKIIDLIVSTQTGYFDGGPINLNPLMQKNIASEFGLHPSTISRAVSNKYVQTPNGLVLLKKLCPREVKGQTREKIKKMVDDIVKKEDRDSPLNDDEIMRVLAGSGVHLERRTIANYRKKLGHEISSKRVKFPGKHDDR